MRRTTAPDPNASHARIYSHWRHLPAFNTLVPLSRCILDDMLMQFTRHEGNKQRLTANQIVRKYRVGHKTARNAIVALEERGWIQRIGLSQGKTGQAGGEYEIMCLTPMGKPCRGPFDDWVKPDDRK